MRAGRSGRLLVPAARLTRRARNNFLARGETPKELPHADNRSPAPSIDAALARQIMRSPETRGRLSLLRDVVGLLIFALCASPVFMPLVLFWLGFDRAAVMWLVALLLLGAGMVFLLRRRIVKRRMPYSDVGQLQRSPM